MKDGQRLDLILDQMSTLDERETENSRCTGCCSTAGASN
jgi:hypothetical protein